MHTTFWRYYFSEKNISGIVDAPTKKKAKKKVKKLYKNHSDLRDTKFKVTVHKADFDKGESTSPILSDSKIDTEIFEHEAFTNRNCFEEILEMVNEFIIEENIKKEDIIEYRTENWRTERNGDEIWHYKVTISWWK